MSEAAAANVDGVFEASRDCFEETLVWLGSAATVLTHGELEAQLDCRGRELLRRMCQAHFDIRARAETRIDAVRDGENVVHGTVETGHRRSLMTIFGEVDVERYAYRHRGHTNLYPADAVLNLPVELHSHGLRRTAAIEVSRGSFDEARRAIERVTGQHVAKRQIEALAARAATDIDSFYACRPPPQAAVTDLLVISADGKGIVMRPDSLGPVFCLVARTASLSRSLVYAHVSGVG